MVPEKLFRTQNGSVFEDTLEAQNESAQEAAFEVIELLVNSNTRYSKDGQVLIENRAEIKKAMNVLTKALYGKLVTTYVI